MKAPKNGSASVSTTLTAVIVVIVVVIAAAGAYFLLSAGGGKNTTSTTNTSSSSSSSENACLQTTGATLSLYQQAQSEGAVTVYGVTPTSVMSAEKAAFEAVCPGITLSYTKYSSGATYTKVTAEVSSGNEQFDLVNENLGPMSLLVSGNYVSNYTIPQESQYPATAKSPLVPEPFFRAAVFVVEYNQLTLKSLGLQPPTSYADLLSPQWSGKIVMVPPNLNPSTTYLFALLNQTIFNGNSSATQNYLTQLGAQKPLFVADYSTAASDLVSGQAAVAITYAQYVTIDASCGCLNYSIPDPLGAQPEIMAIGPNPPHQAAAKLFLDFMYSSQAQQVIANQGIQTFHEGILPNITGWQASYVPVATPVLTNSSLNSLTSLYSTWLGS